MSDYQVMAVIILFFVLFCLGVAGLAWLPRLLMNYDRTDLMLRMLPWLLRGVSLALVVLVILPSLAPWELVVGTMIACTMYLGEQLKSARRP